MVRRYLEVMGNPFDVIVFDPKGKIGLDLGVYATPETFLVNQHGVILCTNISEQLIPKSGRKVLFLIYRKKLFS